MFAFGQRPNLSLDQPLPHQPQAHFHGLPAADLNFNASPQPGIAAGEREYACTLDTLATCGDRPSMMAENVLLVGSEGALDVYKVGSDGSAKIGILQGLRGAVIDARILPWTFREDIYSRERPLIGLVVHGPMLSEGKHKNADAMDSLSSAVYTDDGRSPSPAPQVTAPSDTDEITYYQTTVEIYSLKSGRHIASLLQCPPVPLVIPVTNPVFEPPPPVGELSLSAKGKFITVASGSTGEIFVFSCYKSVSQDEQFEDGFRLIGKFWTVLQHRENQVASPLTNNVERRSRSKSQEPQGIPIASLSHRWLAIVPPNTSSIYSLNATVLLADHDRRPTGFDTHAAPPQPPITCAVDAPDGNGFLNWVAREVTQEVIKGARWVGEQGVQAWKNYWNKVPQQIGANITGDGALVEEQQQQKQQQNSFPPTHGNFMGQAASPASQPSPVAIYDLQRLLDAEETRSKSASTPIATFPVPLGCSFLSFSPHGLWLMTVSKKGDCQFVWDLMRMRHGRPRITPSSVPVPVPGTANPLGGASTKSQQSVQSGPHVRQVALFTRMTVARVVDISWSAPKGNLFSILTEKGTIHIFEIPQSAFQWPPPRSSRKAATPSSKSTEFAGLEKRTGISPAATLGAVSSAVQAINGSTRPFISKAMRLRSSSGGSSGSGGTGGGGGIGIGGGSGIPGLSSLTSIVPAAGTARNSKAVVTAGLSKSLGVASDSVNSIRHAGDNKLHLSLGTGGARPGRVRWLSGRGPNSIAVVMVGSSGSSGGNGTNTVVRTYGVGRYSTFEVNNAHPSTGITVMGTSGMAGAAAARPTTSSATAVRAGSRSRSNGSKRPRSWAVITKARSTEQKVPDIPDLTLAPAIIAYLDHVQSGDNAGEHLIDNGERLVFTDAEGNTKLRSIAAWALCSPVSPSTVPGQTTPNNNIISPPESRSRPIYSTAAHSGDDNIHVSIPLTSPRPHNLSFAEIDSNPPYQPFHTDRRVSLIAYNEPLPPSVPVISSATEPGLGTTKSATVEPWAFGQPIAGRRLQTGHGSGAHKNISSRSTAAGASAGATAITSSTARNGAVQSTTTTTTTMIDPNTLYSPGHSNNNNESYREGTLPDATPTEQIVVTSRRLRAHPGRRTRRRGGVNNSPDVHSEGPGAATERYDGNDVNEDVIDGIDDDGFFEDDCEVLDFATDRV